MILVTESLNLSQVMRDLWLRCRSARIHARHLGPGHAQPFQIARHSIIIQVTLNDALEPSADDTDPSMPSSHQARPDCFQRRSHSSRHSQAPHGEAPSARTA